MRSESNPVRRTKCVAGEEGSVCLWQRRTSLSPMFEGPSAGIFPHATQQWWVVDDETSRAVPRARTSPSIYPRVLGERYYLMDVPSRSRANAAQPGPCWRASIQVPVSHRLFTRPVFSSLDPKACLKSPFTPVSSICQAILGRTLIKTQLVRLHCRMEAETRLCCRYSVCYASQRPESLHS